MNGPETVVKLPVTKYGIKLIREYDSSFSLVSQCVQKGLGRVIQQMVLEDVNPASEDISGQTPLSWASNGHDKVVKLLLEKALIQNQE